MLERAAAEDDAVDLLLNHFQARRAPAEHKHNSRRCSQSVECDLLAFSAIHNEKFSLRTAVFLDCFSESDCDESANFEPQLRFA